MSSIRKLAHLPLLPDGSILNIGGTDFPTFTVGGKALLFADGTTTTGEGGGNLLLNLQQAYSNSSPDGDAGALIKLTPGKNLIITNENGGIPFFSIDSETGAVNIIDRLTVENISFIDFYNEFNAHISGEEWIRHYASNINILPIPQLEEGTVNVQQALEQLSSKLGAQSGANKTLTAGYEHTQQVAALTWTITHNSNTMRAHVTIYNEDWEQIVPEKIKITDANTITVTLSEPMAGKAMVYLMYLGAADENTDDCVLTYPLLPCESTSVRGLVGGYEHIQAIESTTWDITHNANIKRANVTIYDESWEQILPDKVKIINNDVISVTFTTPVSGRALIMLF